MLRRFSELHYFANTVVLTKAIKTKFPSKLQLTGGEAERDRRLASLGAWFDDFLHSPLTPLAQRQLYQLVNASKHIKTAHGDNDTVRRTPGTIIKMGTLSKLGGNKLGGGGNWRPRFFVLSDDLWYYADEAAYQNSGVPKGKVRLGTMFVPTPAESPKFEFTIFALPFEITLRAPDKETLEDWVAALQDMAAN